MTIIAYARQSTNMQQSLNWQVDAISKLARQHNLSVEDVVFFKEIGSGRNTNRKGYREMMQIIEDSEIATTTVLVYRINRIGRSFQSALDFIELCRNKQVRLISFSDGEFDLSKAFDRFKLQLLTSFAENDLENIRDFVTNANREKASQGLLTHTNAPFGYRYKDGNFVVEKHEAKTVRYIYDMYRSGDGYTSISKKLSLSPEYVSLPSYQVRNILMNKSYAGYLCSKHGEYKAPFERIISLEDFQKVTALRKSKQVKRTATDTKLKRLITCPYCSATLTTHRQKSYHYYVCPHHKDDCEFISIKAETIENEVMSVLQDFLISDGMHKRISASLKHIKEYQERKQRKVKVANNKLINQLATGRITAAEFQEQFKLSELKENERLFNLTDQHLRTVIFGKSSHFTLHELHDCIDRIMIDKHNNLTGLYLKNYAVNLVRLKDDFPTTLQKHA